LGERDEDDHSGSDEFSLLRLIVQVYYKGMLGVLDLAHPVLNLMSFVPLEVENE
jgi:hypothetical protein